METSIVRQNLMNVEGYAPYCGSNTCFLQYPRTKWDGEQFFCLCGWRSEFPEDFIKKYIAKWNLQKQTL